MPSFRWKHITPALVVFILSIPLFTYFYSQLPPMIYTSGEGGTYMPSELGMLVIPIGLQLLLVLTNAGTLWQVARNPESLSRGLWHNGWHIAPEKFPAYLSSIFVLLQLFMCWAAFHIFLENLHGFHPLRFLLSIPVFFMLFMVILFHPRWRVRHVDKS